VNKSEIRKKILKIRKQSFSKSFNINIKYILRVLRKKKIYGKIVGGYYPFNYEVDTMEILNDFEKQNYKISLPKIKKNFKMDFFDWSIKEPLIVNNYGIPEPTSNEIVYPNIFLVPLVAYDEKFNRIGYGGGYYDRYFKKIIKTKKIIKIGLAYSFQKVKKIPINDNDMKLDFIITEKNK
tara:strand:- start:250 stop:789 length:540 start_codon:yes stop_codon:yes gene_type:complete